MSVFDDIALGWAGKKYVIPARKVLGAIARIEEVMTLQELLRFVQDGNFPMAKIARAYAYVLRYAGAEITDEEVYEGMFPHGGATTNPQEVALMALQGLMEMMIPPSVKHRTEGTAPAAVLEPGEKEAPLGNSPATAKPSSKPTSKLRSHRVGAVRPNSGTSHRQN
jgi:hypothetical protein